MVPTYHLDPSQVPTMELTLMGTLLNLSDFKSRPYMLNAGGGAVTGIMEGLNAESLPLA